MAVYLTSDDPKMLRETLCVAQSAIGNMTLSVETKMKHLNVLNRLIEDCDRQRPIGPDGKHNDRHTDTCGCEDK